MLDCDKVCVLARALGLDSIFGSSSYLGFGSDHLGQVLPYQDEFFRNNFYDMRMQSRI
jgi:hypothetical protein